MAKGCFCFSQPSINLLRYFLSLTWTKKLFYTYLKYFAEFCPTRKMVLGINSGSRIKSPRQNGGIVTGGFCRGDFFPGRFFPGGFLWLDFFREDFIRLPWNAYVLQLKKQGSLWMTVAKKLWILKNILP